MMTSAASRVFFQADVEVDAVGPDVGVADGVQRPLAPGFVLLLPHAQQAGDRGGRETGHRLSAQQRRQRLLEVAGGEAAQVQHRDRFFQPRRFAHVRRQNAAGEMSIGTTVMHPRRAQAQLASAALDRPLPGLAIAHHQGVALLILAAVAADVFVDFGL